MLPTKCALYFRVSTALQTLECQRPDVGRLVAARGYEVVETYEEQASAAKHRPEFERMMRDAACQGRFSVIVVWALDRFGRSMSGNVADVISLDRLGISVVSVKEPWMDTTGPVRELLVAIFSWCAEQERNRLIERTRAGIAVSRLANPGKSWGRRSPGLIVEEARPRVMREWWQRGRVGGYAALARLLGGCSPTTARKLWLDFTAGTGVPVIHAGAVGAGEPEVVTGVAMPVC